MEFIIQNHHHTPTFESQVMKILEKSLPYMFHTKIECVQTDSAISYQLNPSILSPIV